MGMSTFGLMILLCLLSVCTLVNSASILESSNDLWKNWLLNENEEIPSQQSSPLSRRITPKSVFVAPAFSRCSEGYRPDGMGNCVEIVRLNEAAQWDAVLERLKQMNAQQFGFIKRQSQRNDSNGNGNGNSNSGGEKINHPTKVSNEDTDNAGPFQLSIPFNSRNSSDTQLLPLQNDTSISSSSSSNSNTTTTTTTTEKYPKEISTTTRPTTAVQATTIASYDEGSVSQNTHFVDYATEEPTEVPDLTTFGSVDYQEDTESTQYSTESVNTEVTVVFVADSSTDDTVTESVSNVASHFADFDKINDATEITTHVVKRIPNYNSVVPLKGVANANKNVEQIPISGGGGGGGSGSSSGSGSSISGGLPNFKPFSSYTAGKPDADVINLTKTVNPAKSPAVHIANSFDKNDDDVDGESTVVPGDLFQKLPPSERTKPKCNSNNKYDCLLQINIYPTHKPLFVFNRKPPSPSSSSSSVSAAASSSTAFVRFPETSQKSYVRFPPQKVPVEYDDVALAESNPPYRYWDRRYPTSWLSSWKSKPHFVQIVPENGAGTVYGAGDMNYIRSHPHFQHQTEW